MGAPRSSFGKGVVSLLEGCDVGCTLFYFEMDNSLEILRT
jgi:hypothetical protein